MGFAGRLCYFDYKKVIILLRKINAGRAADYKDNIAFIAFMAILFIQMYHHLFIENLNNYAN